VLATAPVAVARSELVMEPWRVALSMATPPWAAARSQCRIRQHAGGEYSRPCDTALAARRNELGIVFHGKQRDLAAIEGLAEVATCGVMQSPNGRRGCRLLGQRERMIGSAAREQQQPERPPDPLRADGAATAPAA
jgi:hypothetical protein